MPSIKNFLYCNVMLATRLRVFIFALDFLVFSVCGSEAESKLIPNILHTDEVNEMIFCGGMLLKHVHFL